MAQRPDKWRQHRITPFRQHTLLFRHPHLPIGDRFGQYVAYHQLLTRRADNHPEETTLKYLQLIRYGDLHAHTMWRRPGRPLNRIVVGKDLLSRLTKWTVDVHDSEGVFNGWHGSLTFPGDNGLYRPTRPTIRA